MVRAHQPTVCPSHPSGSTHDEIWKKNPGARVCGYCEAPCPAAIKVSDSDDQEETQPPQVFAQSSQVFDSPAPRHQGRINNLKKSSAQAQADARLRKLRRPPQPSQCIPAAPIVRHRGQVGDNFKQGITHRLKEATQETRGKKDSSFLPPSPWSRNGTVSIELVPAIETCVVIGASRSKPVLLGTSLLIILLPTGLF